jgi:uncharacterized protein
MRAGCVFVIACLAMQAAAQTPGRTVTVTVDGVRSDGGRVTGSLCNDPATPFCSTYVARTKAAPGRVDLRFENVAPGRYSLSTVHDEDGDGRTEIPPEGFAFGNNSASPAFNVASFAVEGDMTTAVMMTYPGQVRTGSQGVAPPEGVARIDVRENGLYGELYVPKSAAGRLPALILLEGSSAGLDSISALAPPFAKEGYATLALAYFGEVGLPQSLEGIPLEYFDKAVAWLQAQPNVDPQKIGILGVSRGAEAALLVGARNPAVHAIVAAGPSSVAWRGLDFNDPANSEPAWTVGGAPIPFLSADLSLYDPNGPQTPMFVSALNGADAKPDAKSEAVIAVERINGPLLLISGGDDQIWPSPVMADRIVKRLAKVSFAHEVENVVYPGASHYVFAGSTDSLARALAFFKAALKDRN